MAKESGLLLDVAQHGDAVVVTPHGRLAELEARQLEDELVGRIDQGCVNIVLDMSDVPFVTSACLGAIMLAHKRVRDKNGRVRVVTPQPLVRQILEITKLTKLFGTYDSVEEALKAD